VKEELKRRRWREEELGSRAKGEPAEGGDGGAVEGRDGGDRQMDRQAITDGTPGYLNHLMYRRRKLKGP